MYVAGWQQNETSARLASAWQDFGVGAELAAPTDLQDRVRANDLVLGRLDVAPTLDGVEPGLFELFRLGRRGVRVLNPSEALLGAHDKLRTARLLEGAGLPQPRTVHLTRGREVPLPSLPLVLKPRFGSWGADVFRCVTHDEVSRCLERIQTRPWFQRHGVLAQELVASPGYDLRLIVAGGKAVGAADRIAASGEWRTNIALGGTRRARDLDEGAERLAVAAAAAVAIDLVGVDLLPVRGGYVVLELNGAVDFDQDYSLPGYDIYAEVAGALGLADGEVPDRAAASRQFAARPPV